MTSSVLLSATFLVGRSSEIAGEFAGPDFETEHAETRMTRIQKTLTGLLSVCWSMLQIDIRLVQQPRYWIKRADKVQTGK